jgi:hypothetical protein
VATAYRNSTAYRTSTLDYRGNTTGGGSDASITATAIQCAATIGTATLSAGASLTATAIEATATLYGTASAPADVGAVAVQVEAWLADYTQRHATVVIGGDSEQGWWD